MRVKFTTEFTARTAPRDLRIEELKRWCIIFHNRNLTPLFEGSSLGNLSFRLQNAINSFIITASQLGLKDNLTNDSFVKVTKCDTKTGIVFAKGLKEPSSESILHYAIYRNRPDVNAIFHGHSALILANADTLNIPSTSREQPFGSIELVDSVLEILGTGSFLIMKNHGFLSLGPTMEDAGNTVLRICAKLSAD